MKEVERLPLKDFTRYCMSIAQVPSSYLSGLTMEEQLLWLCSFLTNEVIPTVNNNGEAVEELQTLYIQLKDYVDNYFDNLDVQEEVNNKLEDMAQSGELAELISQYLESQAIIGFNTNAALAAAENLANGSFARTYGKNTYNDGKGAFYKIRTRLNSDDPDGDTLIALTNTDNLVAEIIPYSRGYDLKQEIDEIKNSQVENTIIMGDSYGALSDDTWIDKLIAKIGNKATCYKIALGGLGFSHQSSIGGYTFKTYLESQASEISNPNSIKKILVCGGYNDYDEEYEDIKTAIADFCSYCATTYPNAQVYIGMIGFNKEKTLGGANIRQALQEIVIPAYSYNYVSNKAPIYVENADLLLHNEDLLGVDNIHPNDMGQAVLANGLYQWFINGNINNNTINETIALQYSTDTINLIKTNNNLKLYTYGEITFDLSGNAMTLTSGLPGTNRNVIGTYTCKNLFPSKEGDCLIDTKITLIANGTTYRDIRGVFGLTYDGKTVLYLQDATSGGYTTYSNVTLIRTMLPFMATPIARFN